MVTRLHLRQHQLLEHFNIHRSLLNDGAELFHDAANGIMGSAQ